MTGYSSFNLAQKTAGSRRSLSLLRWALVASVELE